MDADSPPASPSAPDNGFTPGSPLGSGVPARSPFPGGASAAGSPLGSAMPSSPLSPPARKTVGGKTTGPIHTATNKKKKRGGRKFYVGKAPCKNIARMAARKGPKKSTVGVVKMPRKLGAGSK